MTRRIRVLLADDHALVRSTVSSYLRTCADMDVVAEVRTADEAVSEAIRLSPDVAVLDIDMPGLSVFDAVRTIRSRCENVKILFLSAFLHDRYIQMALDVAASGYLTKMHAPQILLSAIRAAASGATYFAPEVQQRLIVGEDGVTLAGASTVASTLTPREIEVLRYIAKGKSKKEIAQIMHLSPKTVDNHSTSLMGKLDIHDRVELARYAIREGIAEV